MTLNVILAGVGGQGILTIAQAIAQTAMRKGLRVKQSEVHGMAQRGGAVQAHLRIADHEPHSDLIPLGEADLLLAVEPLEALRYVEYLRQRGVIVSNSVPFVNIPNYPPVEDVLARIAARGDHVLIDAPRLARAAGAARSENMAMLGAAAACMEFNAGDFEATIAGSFARKGESVVKANQQAFRLGLKTAEAYRDGIRRGATSAAILRWLESTDPERLDPVEAGVVDWFAGTESCVLTGCEQESVAQTIKLVRSEGRTNLYEHEVYRLVERVGAIDPPRHMFVPSGGRVTQEELDRFANEQVVLKLVSPEVTHKTEAGGVLFVPRRPDDVNLAIERLLKRQSVLSRRVEGVLVVEFVEHAQAGFGGELFVGIRATREFGPVIAAGLGGVDTEYLAAMMKPGAAVAKALACDTSPEGFFDLFKKTSAYDILSGAARGHCRIVSDGELIRCFRAFIAIARRYCIEGVDGVGLREMEINPFAFVRQRMVPLDGRGRIGELTRSISPRPVSKIERLLEPRSIAVVGVSSRRANFGRIIVDNIKDCGFPIEHLYIVKDGVERIDGIRCVPRIDALPEKVDLLVAATAGEKIAALLDETVAADKAESVILIPGGIGERAGTEGIQTSLREIIARARADHDGGPVVLGGNCMGVRSAPGRYDTFFIPATKLDPRRGAAPKRVAIISQSGAFIITRMSNLERLDPTFAISLGNQVDITVADMLQVVATRDDIDCVGVYIEGFNDLDGLAFVRAIEQAAAAGKIVIFYKAGRTPAGRDATLGHTAAVAGDYDVCQAAVANAGAIVTDTFKEFEQLLELATDLHGKRVGGRRIGVVSNAGYEAVGMADASAGARYRVDTPDLSDETRERLSRVLVTHGLDGLVNARNPLDITPMADDATYEDCVRVLMEATEIDAVIVGCVPMTPRLLTTSDEITQPGSIADRLPRLFHEYEKPLVFVVDSSDPFDTLARAVRAKGIPVFRSADQAVRSVGRYLCHRTERVRKQNAMTDYSGSQSSRIVKARRHPGGAVSCPSAPAQTSPQ